MQLFNQNQVRSVVKDLFHNLVATLCRAKQVVALIYVVLLQELKHILNTLCISWDSPYHYFDCLSCVLGCISVLPVLGQHLINLLCSETFYWSFDRLVCEDSSTKQLPQFCAQSAFHHSKSKDCSKWTSLTDSFKLHSRIDLKMQHNTQ